MYAIHAYPSLIPSVLPPPREVASQFQLEADTNVLILEVYRLAAAIRLAIRAAMAPAATPLSMLTTARPREQD